MPVFPLPRAPCDNFVYDFSSIVVIVVRATAYVFTIVNDYRAIFVRTLEGLIGTARGSQGKRAISVQSSRSLRKLSTKNVRSPCSFRAEATYNFLGNISTENRKFAARSSRGLQTIILIEDSSKTKKVSRNKITPLESINLGGVGALGRM